MDNHRKELGEYLQALRKRGTPEAFGFPAGARRRTQGLRREEVAQLAGMSATWYTWIEQGREVNLSADACVRLAQALKLTRTERNYLFDIANRRDPQAQTLEDDLAPTPLINLLQHIDVPAYVLGRTWHILAWNKPAKQLFGDWLNEKNNAENNSESNEKPNLLRLVFTQANANTFVQNWETRAKRLVAEFRADCRTRLEEPALIRLVAELSQQSPAFDQFWKQHDVLERQGGLREFMHPTKGLLSYAQVTVRPIELEQLKLVMLSPITSL